MVFHVKHHWTESIYGTELLFDNTMFSVWLRSTQPILDVWPKGPRPAKSLHANLFEIKPGNVTESSVAPHQTNMAILDAPLATNRTTIHLVLVRLLEQVKPLKPFSKNQSSVNQITTEQERSHASGN